MSLSQVIMPKTGAEMEEGKIISWKKQPGERVVTGEVLLEIETDKATMDVEAPATGLLLRYLYLAGETVPATTPIAVLGDGTESPDEIAGFIQGISHPGSALAARAAEPATPQATARGNEQRVKSSPLARRLAQEKGIDLTAVQGTGPDGRIEKDDVLRAAATKEAVPLARSGEVVALSPMRRAIGRRVERSKQGIPDFSVTMSMEMAAALRKKSVLQGAGMLVSLNDLIIFATARTLTRYPDLNSQLEGDSLRRREINIGFALGTDEGLYLPVIRHADQLSIEGIAAATERFTAKAQRKQISEEDMSGGTFTLSNLGMFGVESFTAIIVPSQAAILSVGAVVDQPRRDAKGALTWQPVMAATLTLDHRIADGLAAARFLCDLKAQLNTL